MKKLVTFDLWETLIIDTPDERAQRRLRRIELVRREFARFGLSYTTDQMTDAYDRSWEDVRPLWDRRLDCDMADQVTALLGRLGAPEGALSPADAEQVISVFIQPFFELKPHFLEGAATTVDAARRAGFTIGLISNTGRTPGWALKQFLDEGGVGEMFDFMVFSNETRTRKPGAAIFHYAAGQAGIASGLHIGDSYSADVEGALEAGWQSIWITPDTDGRDTSTLAAVWPDIAAGTRFFQAV